MKCNVFLTLIFILSLFVVHADPINQNPVHTCQCECLNWSEYSTPSEPLPDCSMCNVAACRKMGGSCAHGAIIKISCN
ncbi:unnamed protein product [Adineta ricciae]|uniref:Uncharacterized protein n=1 Tax=Adineta ricciae TaxID=249248 RepID=A0A816EMY1_ADIRI|nr:unnamed protein product [Adineta ricciae]CAF1651765.1 unnamed protein product [Adineta ricciae]